MKLGGDLEGFAEAAYTHIKLRGENGPRSFNSGSTNNWFARNTGTRLNTFAYPYLSPNNVYLQGKLDADMAAKMGGAAGLNYLMLDAPGHFGQKNEDDNYRALAGLRGSIGGGWDFETALSVAGSHSTLFQTINVNTKGSARPTPHCCAKPIPLSTSSPGPSSLPGTQKWKARCSSWASVKCAPPWAPA
jgi:hypothetical protein